MEFETCKMRKEHTGLLVIENLWLVGAVGMMGEGAKRNLHGRRNFVDFQHHRVKMAVCARCVALVLKRLRVIGLAPPLGLSALGQTLVVWIPKC